MNEEIVSNEIKDESVSNKLINALPIVLFVLIVVGFIVYGTYLDKQTVKAAERNAVMHTYQVAENGFKNVLYGQYGDVEVTNEDWGSHSSYGEGDMFGAYLDKVVVNGVGEDEIVLIQYFTKSNGADYYAIADLTKGDSSSNGWIIHREGNTVVFDTNDSSQASSYDSYGVYNVKTNKLYLPKPSIEK